MSHEQDVIHAITLTRIGFYNMAGMLDLLRRAGSATAIMEHSADIRQLVPDASPRLVEAFRNSGDAAHRAEVEYAWAMEHGVRVLCYGSSDYPQRLNDCPDAPLVLYYKGNADLNQRRIVSVVGTRHCTAYGQDIINNFCRSLKELCPDVLIVSGLAYGVDFCAHRNALKNGFDTVGVLAHGLDMLYPSAHRDTAKEMLSHGGLLTEFFTNTNPDKMNFVRRNRIVAGISDATIVVESAARGGSLITADIAQSYARDVFTFPGNVNSPYSEGCNKLIRDNKAALITCAEDFVNAMGWEQDNKVKAARAKGIERQLFPELTAEETRIVELLQKNNDLQLNIIAVQTGLPIGSISALLFSLELKGVIKLYAGGVYHLLG